MSAPKRRLWEFSGPLICRILGLAFDEREIGKIINKFGLKHDQRFSAASEMHGALIHACASRNRASKYVDKILGGRFEPYIRRMEGLDQKDVGRLIEEKDGFRDIPLVAMIWFAVRHQHQDIDEIEARVFSEVHVKEHRALRLYDTLSRTAPDGSAENVVEELKQALKSNDELQRKYKRAEQKRGQLRAEIEAIKEDRASLALTLSEQRQLNEKLSKDLEKLGDKSALAQIESLKKEIELLVGEIETLNEELLQAKQLYRVANEPSPHSKIDIEDEPIAIALPPCEQYIAPSPALNGKRVAFVGGLKTLVPHYRQTVEHLGGIFLAHSGKYTQGKQEIENLVDKADVVFCPVDMNSHHACRHCKKICKLTGKPCCFLRSSSLSMFRKELVNFAKNLN